VGIDSDGSGGVQSNESPCEWSGDSRSMDKSSVGVVAEICRSEVEEVDHQEDLSPEEVRSHEEHDEPEV